LNGQRYEYDDQGRLAAYGPLGGERTRYRYDAAGNRLETHLPGGRAVRCAYDAQGQLVSAGTARYAYDRAGNLAARRFAGELRRFHYNPAGRLTRAERQGRTVWSAAYDHAGRRAATAGSGGATHFLRDPWGNLLAEIGAGGEMRLYLGAAGHPLVCLVLRDGQVTPLYLHADHLGSVRLVTGPTGEVLARFDFDPFGNLPAGTLSGPVDHHPALPTSLRIFAGHPFDAELGWYEAGVRWYDPQVGRFTSPDPFTFSADDPRLTWTPAPPEAQAALQHWLRQPGLRNRYAYALNSPLTYVDPDGRSAGLYALYIFLGIFWALPYTLFGFLLFEVLLNWVTFAFLWDLKDHGYSGEASPRLGAWAWWVKGGLAGKLFQGGATFGNFVVFNTDIFNSLDDTVRSLGIPTHHGELVDPACDTSKYLTLREGVVEHELRHTNQYGWWGPFWMPILLIGLFLIYNLLLSVVSIFTKNGVHVKWGEILDTFFGSAGRGILTGVGLLLSPGIYGWSLITQGYTGSYFELNAAKHSGQATAGQKVLIVPNKDKVAKGGEVLISVITDPSNTFSLALTLKTTNSGAAGGPTQDTTCVLTNLKVFRYIAGPNAGKDVLEATDGADTDTVEIEVE
jgi:RHS repeat-associated protein